jgi:hypothetical protein
LLPASVGFPPEPLVVRLKITRPPSGCIDGIRLDDLVIGVVYEIGTTLGCYLLAQGLAEPVDDDVPTLMPPWTEAHFAPLDIGTANETTPEIVEVAPLSEAADRRRPRRRKPATQGSS